MSTSKPEKALFGLGAIALAALMIVRPPLVDAARHAPAAHTPPDPAPPNAKPETANAPAPSSAQTAPPTGVDLSHYQSQVDWAKAKASGLAFVYAKATEGNTYVDRAFAQHRKGAASQDIRFGAYHFYRPGDKPLAQAQHFVSVAGVANGDLPPALDLEIAPNAGETSAYKKDVQTWLSYVEDKTGCKPIIYASPAFWTAHLGAEFAAYGFWLAEYSRSPKPPASAPDWVFWQHTEKGQLSGIKGLIDMDVAASPDALQNALCTGVEP